MAKIKLPTKPSKLIRIALADLAKAEKSKKYFVEMEDTFHTPTTLNKKTVCVVCFAGAVMANTLGVSPETEAYTSSFGTYNETRLRSLDLFRVGDIESGLNNLGYTNFLVVNKPHIPDYHKSKTGFKKAMKNLATTFEKLGM